jgi:hypothetical protein
MVVHNFQGYGASFVEFVIIFVIRISLKTINQLLREIGFRTKGVSQLWPLPLAIKISLTQMKNYGKSNISP